VSANTGGSLSEVAVSADGKGLYVVSPGSDAVAAFRRDTTSGALTQLAGAAGCVSEDGSGGACADGKALVDAVGVGMSTDGRSIYVASASSSRAVAVFARELPAP
jgi:DNA-binding beta-propeller fold protein YncE